MGRVRNLIINARGSEVRKQIRTQGDQKYTIYNGELWFVELDHQYPWRANSDLMVKVYRLVCKATLIKEEG